MARKVTDTQKTAIDALVAAGAKDQEVSWRKIGVKTGTIKSLIDAGLVIGEVDRSYCIPHVSPKVRLHPDAFDAKAKEEKEQGTCQVCFGGFVVKTKTLVHHGWEEFGGRRAGKYGNCSHEGRCLGAGYLPFEKDCSRTEWYLNEALPGMISERSTLLNKANDPKQRPKSFRVQKRDHYLILEDDGSDLQAFTCFPSLYCRALKDYLYQLERSIQELKSEVKFVRKQLANRTILQETSDDSSEGC